MLRALDTFLSGLLETDKTGLSFVVQNRNGVISEVSGIFQFKSSGNKVFVPFSVGEKSGLAYGVGESIRTTRDARLRLGIPLNKCDIRIFSIMHGIVHINSVISVSCLLEVLYVYLAKQYNKELEVLLKTDRLFINAFSTAERYNLVVSNTKNFTCPVVFDLDIEKKTSTMFVLTFNSIGGKNGLKIPVGVPIPLDTSTTSLYVSLSNILNNL